MLPLLYANLMNVPRTQSGLSRGASSVLQVPLPIVHEKLQGVDRTIDELVMEV